MTLRRAFSPVALLFVALLQQLPSFALADDDDEEAAAVVSTSKLQVHIPQALSKPDGYDHRDALFGLPPYGGSISGKVYYADDDLCGPFVDTSRGYPIELDHSNDDNNNNNTTAPRLPWQTPYILMVDRGNCTFVEKVRNAERAGASAVLIADNKCLCGELHQSCVMDAATQTECEREEPLMADDGQGADITIPSFLTFKQDADGIKQVLVEKNQPVLVEMSFHVPAPDGRVEYDLWTTPTDDLSLAFLDHFESAAVALGETAYFTPRMYVYDGMKAGCHSSGGTTEVNWCGNLCSNAGRYCATDPDGDLDVGVSGEDVVAESLRRMCIWEAYGKTDGVGEVWWKYVQEFNARCNDSDRPGNFNEKECYEDAMKAAKVNVAYVDKCIDESGGLGQDVVNTMLESSVHNTEMGGSAVIPTLYVNQAPVRGELVYATVFEAICSGYSTGTLPHVCKMCATCPDKEDCVLAGQCPMAGTMLQTGSAAGVSSATFAVSILMIVLFFSVFGVCLYRQQRRKMREEVRGIMAEYMPVDPNKTVVDTCVSDEML